MVIQPSHVGAVPLHVPVVAVPPFVSSQTLVVCPTRANPVLHENVATDPRLRFNEWLPGVSMILSLFGSGSSKHASECVWIYACTVVIVTCILN